MVEFWRSQGLLDPAPPGGEGEGEDFDGLEVFDEGDEGEDDEDGMADPGADGAHGGAAAP